MLKWTKNGSQLPATFNSMEQEIKVNVEVIARTSALPRILFTERVNFLLFFFFKSLLSSSLSFSSSFSMFAPASLLPTSITHTHTHPHTHTHTSGCTLELTVLVQESSSAAPPSSSLPEHLRHPEERPWLP